MKRLGVMAIITSFVILPVMLCIDSIMIVLFLLILALALFGGGLAMYCIAQADELMLYDEETDELKPLSDWEQVYLTAIKSRKKESKERGSKDD